MGPPRGACNACFFALRRTPTVSPAWRTRLAGSDRQVNLAQTAVEQALSTFERGVQFSRVRTKHLYAAERIELPAHPGKWGAETRPYDVEQEP